MKQIVLNPFKDDLPTPSKITVTGSTWPCWFCWPNDEWNLNGYANGRPQWARRGHPTVDKIKWDGNRWILHGHTGPERPGFVCNQDTPLPPKNGW